MQLRIAVLGGDGVGPKVTAQAVKCLKAVGETFNHDFHFSKGLIGKAALKETGSSLPVKTLETCVHSDAILLGALEREYNIQSTTVDTSQQSLGKLRKELGLFANIRPVKLFPGITTNSPFVKNLSGKVDLHIYREQLGGLYNGKGTFDPAKGISSDTSTYSEKEISRIAHLAFKAAKRRYKKVTLVDKANVLETSKLWRTTVKTIAGSYPDVTLECLEIDNAMVRLTLDPSSFDILLTDTLFGDVLSGLGSILLGVQGLLPSASLGEHHCMFKPTHGALPEEKGKNTINPIASIFSAIMLLEKFGLREESQALFTSVSKAFSKNIVVPDVLGSRKYGTDYVGDFIADNITDSDIDLNMNDENIGLGKSTII